MTGDAISNLRVRIHPVVSSQLRLSLSLSTYWPIAKDIGPLSWASWQKYESQRKKGRVGGERYVNYVSTICKRCFNFCPTCICQTHLVPGNLVIWLSHLALASHLPLPLRRNPLPGALFSTTNQPTEFILPTTSLIRLSNSEPLRTCTSYHRASQMW